MPSTSALPTTLHALRGRLLQAGADLLAAHPPKAAPTGGDAAFVLGVLGLATLVLTANRYAVPWLARALAEAVPTETIADPRRVYWALLTAGFYILPPLLFCQRLLPHARLSLGLTATHLGAALRLWLAFALFAAPVLVGLSLLPSFQAVYPMARGNSADACSMTAFLLAYGLQFVGVELFFRGFLLLVLRPVLGLWGVAVMLLPYTMLHFSKPPLETLGSMLFGLMLALTALRSRSILDGVGIHLILAFTLELLGLCELPRVAYALF